MVLRYVIYSLKFYPSIHKKVLFMNLLHFLTSAKNLLLGCVLDVYLQGKQIYYKTVCYVSTSVPVYMCMNTNKNSYDPHLFLSCLCDVCSKSSTILVPIFLN